MEYGFNRLSKGDDIGREMKDGYPDPRKEYFKFMFTRHPLDRLASGYLDKCVKEHGYRLPVIRMKVSSCHNPRKQYYEILPQLRAARVVLVGFTTILPIM